MNMKIEVITDEAVKNQVEAVSKYAEAVSEYISFLWEEGTDINKYTVVDIINLEELSNRLTRCGDKLGNTSTVLVAENSYIEAVAKK